MDEAALTKLVGERTAAWTPEQRNALLHTLNRESRRLRAAKQYDTPGKLAQALDPSIVQTPAMQAIDDVFVDALATPNARKGVTIAPQQGKLVADGTPVPTLVGWTTHGELKVGDEVMHPSGRPVRVVDVLGSDYATIRLHFSNGDHVDVHPRHEWTLWRDNKLRTMETQEIITEPLTRGEISKRGGGYRYHLPHVSCLQFADADLPIDPYTLGLWLGDGRSSGAYITHAAGDRYEYAYPVSSSWTHPATGAVSDYLGGGFLTALRSAGLLNNKHIPGAYLRASERQRRALLAGLIDSDGYVPNRGQQVTFDNTNKRLIDGLAELLRTLGYNAHTHNPIAPSTGGTCNGRAVEGRRPTWRVAFSPHDGHQPSTLPRYQGRIEANAIRRRRALVGYEYIDATPGRCITVDSDDGLYLVGRTMIPTHNSTRLAVYGVVDALLDNPDRRVVVSSYSEALARTHVRAARDIIKAHGSNARDPLTGAKLPDKLGIAISDGNASAASWTIQGHRGGCYAVGVGGSLTGRACDLLIIDDPHKGMAEADSAVERHNVLTWWESVAQTRLAPGAPVFVIQTRWHVKDLLGHLLELDAAKPEESREWDVLNIPAIAEAGVPDALGREPGTPLESTRGHTIDDWLRIKEQVGPRVWSALYQGQPTPGEGGLFSQDWFDRYRLPALPEHGIAARVVSVDPAETGKRDEAGVVALAVSNDSRVMVTDDRSGRMQSDQWARAAVKLALEVGASELVFEAFTTGPTYERVIQQAWQQLRLDARALRQAGGDVADAAIAISQRDDPPGNAFAVAQEVQGLDVPDQVDPPFRVHAFRMKGDKVARAAGTRQAASTGRLRMVGSFPSLEGQACHWQAGQASPDRMDALTQGFERCVEIVGATSVIAVPGSEPALAPAGGFSWGSIPSGL